jgi:hypothetical protein
MPTTTLSVRRKRRRRRNPGKIQALSTWKEGRIPTGSQLWKSAISNSGQKWPSGSSQWLIKDLKVEVDSAKLHKCLAVDTGRHYCRYSLEVSTDSASARILAILLDLGFLMKEYNWSSFEVCNGRWQIIEQYESCTEIDTSIRCREL